MKAYLDIVRNIFENGVEKSDRTGTGTISTFGLQFKHDMRTGFPLLTTKKMAFKQIVEELLWFMSGSTNIKPLVEKNTNIWNGDAYKFYKTYAQLHIDLKLPCKDFTNDGKVYTMQEFVQAIKDDNFVNELNCSFAEFFAELGPVYGAQWRSQHSEVSLKLKYLDYLKTKTSSRQRILSIDDFENVIEASTYRRDQLQDVIDTLSTNPDDRRMIVNSWNVSKIDAMLLPPCHYAFQFYSERRPIEDIIKEFPAHCDVDSDITEYGIDFLCKKYNVKSRYLSLMWNQRSVDTGLGLPFNIASYGLLLHFVCSMVNMVPKMLIGNLGDTHIYKDHIEQLHAQLQRTPLQLPTLKVKNPQTTNIDVFIEHFQYKDIELSNYTCYDTIKMPLSN